MQENEIGTDHIQENNMKTDHVQEEQGQGDDTKATRCAAVVGDEMALAMTAIAIAAVAGTAVTMTAVAGMALTIAAVAGDTQGGQLNYEVAVARRSSTSSHAWLLIFKGTWYDQLWLEVQLCSNKRL